MMPPPQRHVIAIKVFQCVPVSFCSSLAVLTMSNVIVVVVVVVGAVVTVCNAAVLLERSSSFAVLLDAFFLTVTGR